MNSSDRGGRVYKTGLIGRCNVLRQQLLAPGEFIRPRISTGMVRLAALREVANVRIHARLECFATPLRWLWADLPDYIKEGPSSTKSLPTVTMTDLSHLGIGGQAATDTTIYQFFRDAPLKCYNEYFKWPYDDDITDWPEDGPPAVALPMAWTRLQDYPHTDYQAEDSTVDMKADPYGDASVAYGLDVRDLPKAMANYRNFLSRTYLSAGRYKELLSQIWGARNVTSEVDKVPYRLKGAAVGMSPKEAYASDGPSLGQAMSMYNFSINHNFGSFLAPEHTVLTYILVLRYEPCAEDEINPLSLGGAHDRDVILGQPDLMGSTDIRQVQAKQLHGGSVSAVRGYLPSGWQWRSRWNCVGRRIDDRNTFPFGEDLSSATTAAELRNATRILPSFYSASLGHYVVDAHFSELSTSRLPSAGRSVAVGTGRRSVGKSNYPVPGPMV